ncbi:MAG: tRNA (guanosine(37)-N1)-methyltransferase TrmD [Candidatus Omnitrophota bacterium]
MLIDILTLFPGMFKGPFDESMIRIAREKGLLEIAVHNLRNWTEDRHRTADDKPFGGGSGMVMKVEPVYRALKDLLGGDPAKKTGAEPGTRIVLMTPQGKRLDQGTVKALSQARRLIILCGHYEGVDERIRGFADDEISIGDYVLTCGELPACVLVDSVMRLIPGVLGDPGSLETETFENDLFEYPQYTRPRVFEGMRVPEVLLSGDHKKIAAWRRRQAVIRTKRMRPDLIKPGAGKTARGRGSQKGR